MAVTIILLCIGALIALSGFYRTRFPAKARVAMQWGLDGKPTWRAPVWAALSITPVIALFTLALTALGAAKAPALVHGIMWVEAAFLVIIHAAHMHFALRDQRKRA